MGKQMKTRWLWAGALASTLALGAACSATEAPVQLAQATPSTGQPGTGGTSVPGTTTPDTTVPGTMPPDTTVPGTTAPGTTTTAPGTGMGGSGTAGSAPLVGTDAGTGMGGSGTTPGLDPNTSGTSGTFQPPTGSSVLDGGTGF